MEQEIETTSTSSFIFCQKIRKSKKIINILFNKVVISILLLKNTSYGPDVYNTNYMIYLRKKRTEGIYNN